MRTRTSPRTRRSRRRDGHLVVAVGNDAQFGRLLGVLGLVDDGRYATNPMRIEAQPQLAAWLGEAISQWSRSDLLEALTAADVPAGPVNTVPEALAVLGDGWIEAIDGIRVAPNPIRIDGERAPLRLAPPRLGEHTDDVLGRA